MVRFKGIPMNDNCWGALISEPHRLKGNFRKTKRRREEHCGREAYQLNEHAHHRFQASFVVRTTAGIYTWFSAQRFRSFPGYWRRDPSPHLPLASNRMGTTRPNQRCSPKVLCILQVVEQEYRPYHIWFFSSPFAAIAHDLDQHIPLLWWLKH